MSSMGLQRRRLLYSAVGVAVVVLGILAVLLYLAINSATTANVADVAKTGAAENAAFLKNAIQSDIQLATAISSQDGIVPVLDGNADHPTTNRVESTILNIQQAYPQVSGLYLFD